MTADGGRHCFELEFCADAGGRSFVGAQFVRYPFHVCRALYADADVDAGVPGACGIALQSVSGGLFEDERVSGRLHARAGARASVTTSASTIVHAMRGGWATQSVELVADAGALLDYLPEPLILFPGSRLRTATTVRADPASVVVLQDSFLGHDPASSGQTFGSLDASVTVLGADGGLLARERLRLDGPAWHGARPGVSGGFTVHAGLWIIRRGDNAALLRLIRDALAGDDATAVHAGASELPNGAGVLVRMLAADAVGLRRALRSLHARLRRWLPDGLAAAAAAVDRIAAVPQPDRTDGGDRWRPQAACRASDASAAACAAARPSSINRSMRRGE